LKAHAKRVHQFIEALSDAQSADERAVPDPRE
jgi:hypothetical protein